jgi:hypothetical protein
MSSRRSAADGPAPALQPEVLDAGAGRLADPQPVQRQQGDQVMLGGWPEPGGDQDCAGLVAGQAAVPGQEPGEREPLGLGEHWLDGDERGSGGVAVIGRLPGRLRPGSQGPAARPQK